MVELAGQTINTVLGDDSPRNYYTLLWALLRLHDTGQDYFQPVYDLLLRVCADRQEGFARNPGALFQARLKQTGFWELLRSTPQTRVAPKPGA